MRRLNARGTIPDELKQLGAEEPHRASGQLVGAIIIFRVLPDRLEIGAKDKGRSVDKKDVIASLNRTVTEAHAVFLSGN
jgi:hypothetical protein